MSELSTKTNNYTNKCIFCMIILFISIIIHYFINSNYYNLRLDTEKCPFCYGNDLCAIFDNNEITFSNLTFLERISNLINTKNVYVANYKTSKVILKKLGHNWELSKIDNKICMDQHFEKNCPPYPASYHKDFTNNIIEFLKSGNMNSPLNLKICNLATINKMMNNLFSLFTHVNISVMTANIWTTLLANAEPLILQVLNAKDDWPVPIHHGSCGRIIVQEYCGQPLHSVEHQPWKRRANLTLQLLKAADEFTNKHPVFRFYLTDVSSDNIVVTEDFKIKFIDLENVIINEKVSDFEDSRIHESQNPDCDSCYEFSPDEICSHRISDHNVYSICKLLLSTSSPWPMMENGLLHSPPEEILRNYPEIFHYVEVCADSSKNMNRFEASRKLMEALQAVIEKEEL